VKKICHKCGDAKIPGDFNVNRSRKDGRSETCRSCHSKYGKRHYEENKVYYLEKAARSRATVYQRLRAIVVAAKSVPCPDCGRTYHPVVMDFDHVHGIKVQEIAVMVRNGVTESALRMELAKCEAVCANCHRLRTHSRREKKRLAV